MTTIKILGLSGSSSKRSYNTALLRALGDVFPKEIEFKIFEGHEQLPFYSPEHEESEVPQGAITLRAAIGNADAIVIASPEYNYSISALTKNTLDWASRPYGAQVLIAKPVLIIGASPSQFGTVRAQAHLREILHATQSTVVHRPEVLVSQAPGKFDENMTLTDQATIDILKTAGEALMALIAPKQGEKPT